MSAPRHLELRNGQVRPVEPPAPWPLGNGSTGGPVRPYTPEELARAFGVEPYEVRGLLVLTLAAWGILAIVAGLVWAMFRG